MRTSLCSLRFVSNISTPIYLPQALPYFYELVVILSETITLVNEQLKSCPQNVFIERNELEKSVLLIFLGAKSEVQVGTGADGVIAVVCGSMSRKGVTELFMAWTLTRMTLASFVSTVASYQKRGECFPF